MPIRAIKEPELGVKLDAFPYQQDAFERVRALEYGAVLHEQGLGKTKIAIDVAMSWLSEGTVDSVLIVTKRGLVDNWCNEVGNHTHMAPRILDQNRSGNFRAFNSPARLYLTHYETLVSEQKRLALFLRTRNIGVILDEAHKIKNPDARVTQALFALRAGFVRRLIVTGTPVANRPQDIWAPVFFLDGGEALGRDYEEFKGRVNLVNTLANDPARRATFEAALSDIAAKIAVFTVRETKDSAGIELPEKTIVRKNVPMEHRQQEIYDRYLTETQFITVQGGKPIFDDAEETLKRLTRLIQLASNPMLVDESYAVEAGKVGVLRLLLAEANDRNEKTIVWTNFVKNAKFLTNEFRGLGAVVVHGQITIDERNAALRAFKENPTCRVLVATPGAAKEGLTLTVANNAIFFDRSLSLEDYLQAQDRIHRISQTRPALITNLVSSGSIDEWVDALLESKRSAARLSQGDIGIDAFTAEMSYDYGAILRAILARANPTTQNTGTLA